MTEARVARERLMWTVAVTVLASTVAWLGAIAVALAVRTSGVELPPLLVAFKALVRVAWLLLRESGPIAPFALLVPGLFVLFVRMLRDGLPFERGARHA